MTDRELREAYNALREKAVAWSRVIHAGSQQGIVQAMGIVHELNALPPLPVQDVPEVGSRWRPLGHDGVPLDGPIVGKDKRDPPPILTVYDVYASLHDGRIHVKVGHMLYERASFYRHHAEAE